MTTSGLLLLIRIVPVMDIQLLRIPVHGRVSSITLEWVSQNKYIIRHALNEKTCDCCQVQQNLDDTSLNKENEKPGDLPGLRV